METKHTPEACLFDRDTEVNFLNSLAENGGLADPLPGMLRHCARLVITQDLIERFRLAAKTLIRGEVGADSRIVRRLYGEDVKTLGDVLIALEYLAGNVSEPLWCLHILGPDDMHPAPSREVALMAAKQFNETFPQNADAPCEATVSLWPYSVESHAETVGTFFKDWWPEKRGCADCLGQGGHRWRESDGSERGETCGTCDGFGWVSG